MAGIEAYSPSWNLSRSIQPCAHESRGRFAPVMSWVAAKRSSLAHWKRETTRASSDIGWPFATRGGNELTQQLWRAREEEVAFGFDPSDSGIKGETTATVLELVASDLHPELPARRA